MRSTRLSRAPHAALEALYRAHYAALLTSTYARVSDREEAEDIVSKTFLIAVDRIVEGHVVDVAWLRSCTYNLVGSEYQRRERMSRPVLRALVRETTDGPEEAFATRDFFERGLAQLPPLDREIIMLSAWSDLSIAQIAAMTGLSHGAAKMRLSRARCALRNILRANRDRWT